MRLVGVLVVTPNEDDFAPILADTNPSAASPRLSHLTLRLGVIHAMGEDATFPTARGQAQARRGSRFTLKVDTTARDNQSAQDNEKHKRGDYRPPIIFGAPWVGPPTVAARSTSAFKISMYHR
jgi:hypothetical protein